MQNVMTSSDGRDLMTAIVQSPADDAPRLRLADWLERHGDPDRATFIRLQCEVENLPPGAERKRRVTTADALLKRHEAEWSDELGIGFTHPAFKRGFVTGVTMTADDFLKHAGRLMSHTPLREVAITDSAGHMPRLAASPDLGRLDRLRLASSKLDCFAAQELAESPYLHRVEVLDLWANRIGADGARAILDATAGGRTRQIEFGSNLLGEFGAMVLAEHPAMADHTALLLFENHIGRVGAEILANSPHFKGVTDCILEFNEIGNRGAAALARSCALRPEVLDLSLNGITDAGVEVLARSRLLKRALYLGLADNRVGDRGALALARSRRLRHLRTLSIAGNRITDAGARALRDGLADMDTLFMTDNRLSRRVAEELFVLPWLTGELRGRGEEK
jgi:uncharacterized protein (TIGR02996 family)